MNFNTTYTCYLCWRDARLKPDRWTRAALPGMEVAIIAYADKKRENDKKRNPVILNFVLHKIHFHQWKLLHFHLDFTGICFRESNWRLAIISSDNGGASNRQMHVTKPMATYLITPIGPTKPQWDDAATVLHYLPLQIPAYVHICHMRSYNTQAPVLYIQEK